MYCMAGRQWDKGRHKKELMLDIMHIDLRLMVAHCLLNWNKILKEFNHFLDQYFFLNL
jgi:hypothetical protein